MRFTLRKPTPAPEADATLDERLQVLADAIADAESDRKVLAGEREEIVAAQEALPDVFVDARLGRVAQDDAEAHRDDLASRLQHVDAELERLDGEIEVMRRRAADLIDEIRAAEIAGIEEKTGAAQVLAADAWARFQERQAVVRGFESDLEEAKERSRWARARFDERIKAAAERAAQQEYETAVGIALMPKWGRDGLVRPGTRLAELVDQELARRERDRQEHIRVVLRQSPEEARAREEGERRRLWPREPGVRTVALVEGGREAEATE